MTNSDRTGPLGDQVALVTGGGSGIGAAISRELAARGANVVVTDIDGDAADVIARSIDENGASAISVAVDVTDAESIEAAAVHATNTFGQLTAWVSNAGISSMYRFEDLPLSEWQANLEVNATGVFLCGQAAARHLVRPGGSIVNIASMAGKQGRVPYLAHYVASKFAVVGLTQAMAYELGPSGLRVNAVCPGFVETSMQARELEWEGALRGIEPAAVRKLMIDETPLGRIQTPADVARIVAFLCSPDAEFVTGESIAVNGGAFMD